MKTVRAAAATAPAALYERGKLEQTGHQPQGESVSEASPRGTYLQISESLRQKIEKGKISEALPSEAELRNTYGVGRSTITRALKVLKTEGIIESVQGSGWYVTGTGDRRPLVEKVTDLLGNEGIEVGAPFPSEKELCERFSVSRTAVRSAIAQMEGQGLIAMGPNRRRVVRALPTANEESQP